jgi:predicted AlkP superfamily phosphohydrolase/phosphomutase
MTSPTRVLVLGIDAASPALLDAWIADGTLPNLGALVDRGIAGRTHGIDGFFIGSTWPSMYTGTNPAHHGVHYLVQIVPGTYRLHHCATGTYIHRPPFWRALSDAGRRVAILDVPLSRLDSDLNGVHVVEWGGHDSLYGFQCAPPALGEELVARYGRHPLSGDCDGDRTTAQDFRAFLDQLELGVARKLALTTDLLSRGGWDMFMQVFTEAHCTGHQCWHLHDALHPAHDPSIASALGDPLRRMYRTIDRSIGELLRTVGDDTTAIVFSAHGMSHWYGAQFLLRDILLRLGVTTPLPAPARKGPSRAEEVARMAWRTLPVSVRGQIKGVRQRLRPARSTVREPTIPVDAASSLCFPLANGLAVGGIRLNLVGREPAGRLEPGAEADAFVRRLSEDLLAIIDERTGRPLVRRVVRAAELYEGELLDHLPDVLVEWSEAGAPGSTANAGGRAAIVRAQSPKIGVIEGANEYGRTGEHRPGGWFAAAGPGVGRGRLEREVSLMDLAPTITHLLGVELRCDGEVIGELA